MSFEFDLVLDECLGSILRRGASVDECLARYPQYAEGLGPLLRVAVEAQAAYVFAPTAQAKAAGRDRLQAALRARAKPRPLPTFVRPRWAFSIAAVLALLVVGLATAVVASPGSVPGDLLYPVKRASENVRVAFTSGDASKARFYAGLVDERVQELAETAATGKVEEIEALTRDIQGHLARVAELSEKLSRRGVEGVAAGPGQASPAVPQPTLEAGLLAERALTPSPLPPTPAGRPPAAAVQTPQKTARPEGAAQAAPKGTPARPEEVLAPAAPMRSEGLRGALEKRYVENIETLGRALERAPEQAKPAMLQAIEVARTAYQKAIEAAGQPTPAGSPIAATPTPQAPSPDERERPPATPTATTATPTPLPPTFVPGVLPSEPRR